MVSRKWMKGFKRILGKKIEEESEIEKYIDSNMKKNSLKPVKLRKGLWDKQVTRPRAPPQGWCPFY